ELGSIALQAKIISADELALWQRKEALRRNVIKVDDFPQDFGRAELAAKQFDKTPAAKAA
ncbi:MAG: hypothetical protein ACREIB_06400, partial [Pseudomonadota bacterium]